MKNLSKFLIISLTAVSSMTANAQIAETKGLQKRVETINLLSDKASYLDSLLDHVKTYPGKFSTVTKSEREAAKNNIQIEYNSILLTIFNKSDQKGVSRIKKSMSKAFSDCFKLLDGDKLTKERQDNLDQLIADTKVLIRRYSFLSEARFGNQDSKLTIK
ncbi:hypothetical protein G7074_21510 [Pedobacter sp. HDW13]|uniref:hypothetical protein n=1 Tax=unclassified Pedobacter TaxID=2628915 RepID=UPI000F5987AC|nr:MULTISPECIES: hypothetical protein [unclassified Pedobacter]QIL41613.1 hypothetical protein G7074_21510 [Pedobacter sp. HDW13]RQO64783.1 hypothetical protein DBR40_25065 [Pedobacter sp. KBW01]